MYVRGHEAWPLAVIGRVYGVGGLETAARGIRIALGRESVRRRDLAIPARRSCVMNRNRNRNRPASGSL
jgi:hypothetical protein